MIAALLIPLAWFLLPRGHAWVGDGLRGGRPF